MRMPYRPGVGCRPAVRRNAARTAVWLSRSLRPLRGTVAQRAALDCRVSLFCEEVQLAGRGVRIHLPIPGVLEFHFAELREELILLGVGKVSDGIDNLGHRAHAKK